MLMPILKRRQPPGDRQGFTLAELMVTIGLIAILAAVALPQFQKTIRRGHRQAAIDILRTIFAGEQVRKSVNGQFLALTDTSPNWNDIFMDNPNSVLPVTFAVTATLGPPPTFTATATYTPTSQTMTINQASTLDTSGWPQP